MLVTPPPSTDRDYLVQAIGKGRLGQDLEWIRLAPDGLVPPEFPQRADTTRRCSQPFLAGIRR